MPARVVLFPGHVGHMKQTHRLGHVFSCFALCFRHGVSRHTQPAQLHSNKPHTRLPGTVLPHRPVTPRLKKSQTSFLSVTLAVTPLTLRYAELTQTSACDARPFKIKASQGINLQVTTFFFQLQTILFQFFFLEDFLFF